MANIITASRAPSAGEKVFRTFDLAEDIILRLEGRDIFVIQRVCHAINNTIADSNRLQRKLFLKADSRVIGRIHNSMLTSPPSHTETYTLGITQGEEPMWLFGFPKPGSCLKMFITQPPMTDVVLWTDGVAAKAGGLDAQAEGLVAQADALSPNWGRSIVMRKVVHARVENKDGVTWGDVCEALIQPNASVDEPWPIHVRDEGRVAAGAAIVRKEKERRGRDF